MKQSPLKNFALFVAALLLGAPLAQATPYASSITNNGTTISFRLNESADSVKIISSGGAVTNDLGARPFGLTVTSLTIVGVFQIEVPNAPAGAPPSASWVSSTYLNWANSVANTNNRALENSPLGPYCGRDVDIFRCPADTERAQNGGRVRSFPMNCQMGAIGGTIPGPPPVPYTPPNYNPGWRAFKRTTDLVDFKPSDALIFLEEHPDSINDGYFLINLTTQIFPDVPGSNHDGVGTASFGDGHIETHRWDTRPPVKRITLAKVTPSARDWQWLTSHTSVR